MTWAIQLEDSSQLDGTADSLQPWARRLADGASGPALRGDWLGHAAHSMLTDLPIGFWTASFVLDLLGGKAARPASARLIALGLMSAVPAVASGAVEWSDVDDDRPRRVGVAHAAANVTAVLLYVASWRARRQGQYWRGVLIGLVAVAAATECNFRRE